MENQHQIVHADGVSLKQEIADNELVLVDFWATWCAPCRAMAPSLERLVGEFPNLKIVKIDADAHEELLEEYDVKSLPTLLLYRSGNRVNQLLGNTPYTLMQRAIQSEI